MNRNLDKEERHGQGVEYAAQLLLLGSWAVIFITSLRCTLVAPFVNGTVVALVFCLLHGLKKYAMVCHTLGSGSGRNTGLLIYHVD